MVETVETIKARAKKHHTIIFDGIVASILGSAVVFSNQGADGRQSRKGVLPVWPVQRRKSRGKKDVNDELQRIIYEVLRAH